MSIYYPIKNSICVPSELAEKMHVILHNKVKSLLYQPVPMSKGIRSCYSFTGSHEQSLAAMTFCRLHCTIDIINATTLVHVCTSYNTYALGSYGTT
jgi:hypothetical protein